MLMMMTLMLQIMKTKMVMKFKIGQSMTHLKSQQIWLEILRTVIAGGMTPHLQLTDIMSAKMSHECGRQWMDA